VIGGGGGVNIGNVVAVAVADFSDCVVLIHNIVTVVAGGACALKHFMLAIAGM
jgi:hypothetical protein